MLHDLWHLDVDPEDLLEKHLHDLALVGLVVGANLSELVVHVVLLADDLIIVCLALGLFLLVALFELLCEKVYLQLSVGVGIGDALGPTEKWIRVRIIDL